MRFTHCLISPALAAGFCLCASAARADAPLLVELFLSQSCKASPPAADISGDLAARQDAVLLVYHVGYWDMMPGSEGEAWRDPFSKTSFADRHRQYNLRLRGKNRGMTPQAVVHGVATGSAAKRDYVEMLLDKARGKTPESAAQIRFEENGDTLAIAVEGSEGEAYLARFIEEAVTEIGGGDNNGMTFRESNVVTALQPLGAIAAGGVRFNTAAPEAGQGCAVLVQEPGHGRVIAARYCPD